MQWFMFNAIAAAMMAPAASSPASPSGGIHLSSAAPHSGGGPAAELENALADLTPGDDSPDVVVLDHDTSGVSYIKAAPSPGIDIALLGDDDGDDDASGRARAVGSSFASGTSSSSNEPWRRTFGAGWTTPAPVPAPAPPQRYYSSTPPPRRPVPKTEGILLSQLPYAPDQQA